MKQRLSANSTSLTLFAQMMASALAFYAVGSAPAAEVTEFADGLEVKMTEGQTVSKDLVGGQLNVNGTINTVSDSGYLSKFYFDGTPSTEADSALTTNVTVGAGAAVDGELIGGSYIRTSGDTQKMAVASTTVNVDGGTVGENVFGGGKTNIWGSKGPHSSDVTGSASITVTNGASVGGIVFGGGSAKATGGTSSTSADVNKTSITINGDSVVSGVVAGGHAYLYSNGGTAHANVSDTASVIIDGAVVNKANYQGYAAQPLNFAVIGGGLADTTKLSSGSSGAASTSLKTADIVIRNGATINGDVYAGGAALGTGSAATVDDAHLVITDSTVNGSVFSYGLTENGTASVTKSLVELSNSTVDGIVDVSGADHQLKANNLTVTGEGSAKGTTYVTGINVADGASAYFGGDYLHVQFDTESTESVLGVLVNSGSSVEFASDETVIDVSSVGSSSKWGFGLRVYGDTGSSANFTGGNVTIKDYCENYTAQTLTVKAGSTISFNNKGDVFISAESPFGVTAVDAFGTLTFNNSGNVQIEGTIVPGTHTAQTNVVGIQGTSATWKVSEAVQDFSIVLTGQGVDNDGTSYSTGTVGIDGEDVDFTFSGKNLNIQMDIASDVQDAAPGTHTAEIAYGMNLYGGSSFELASASALSITVNEGLGTAYGINLSASTANIKGNATIAAVGKESSYALNLDSEADASFSGTSNTLTGDASVANASKLSFANGETTINGNVTFDATSSIAVQNAVLQLNGTMTQTSSSAAQNAVLQLNGTMTLEGTETVGAGLTLTNSTLTVSDAVSLLNFTADGATILYTNLDEGTAFTTAASTIKEGGLTLAGSGALNDSTSDAAALMSEIAQRSTTGAGSEKTQLAATTVVLQEGELVGERVGQVQENGSVKVISQAGASQNVKTIGDAAASNLLVWRSEMNSLNKRLGELRDSEGNTGAWARVNAGSFSGSDMNVDNDFVTLQVGADTKLPTAANIHVGSAFGYTDGDLSYDRGDGTTKSYSLALYGSWLGEQGQFLDVIAKYARLSTEASAGTLNADFHSNAFSVSAETGWRFDCPTMPFFVEPQAELSYGYVDGQTFQVSDSISGRQDSMDSLIGRLGFRLGLQCPEKRGNAYLHASVLHDFLGDTSVTMKNSVQSVDYVQDFGGTWFEYGIGGTFRMTAASYVYADLQRTDGGKVDEDWRANVGVRFAF